MLAAGEATLVMGGVGFCVATVEMAVACQQLVHVKMWKWPLAFVENILVTTKVIVNIARGSALKMRLKCSICTGDYGLLHARDAYVPFASSSMLTPVGRTLCHARIRHANASCPQWELFLISGLQCPRAWDTYSVVAKFRVL